MVSDAITPERWRQVTKIFHAAIAYEGSPRAEYLDHACGSDRELRREVDAMLAAHAAGAGFGETPVYASAVDGPRLVPGTMIGSYRIDALIGAGGMGEIYRARDTKLGRDVAVKVLPAAFTSDPDRLARLEREARLLAALNHPHVAAIHSIEAHDGTRALVLELVDGPMLAERLASGPLSLREALDIARQVAEALEAAHEHGIIHRDLKPANIKLTPEGAVKVLDFGLAKAFAGEASIDLSQASVLPATATHEGVLAGTPSYISPEQARGQPVDKRTDIWAFGCVLYELLTALPAFPGETISDTIAAILDREPDWRALPQNTPPSIRRLLQRCLEKDRRRRLRDIADVRFAIEDSANETERTAATPAVTSRSGHRAVTTVGTLFLAAALGIAWWARRPSAAPADNPLATARFTRLTDFPGAEQAAAISRDGRFVAFLSDRDSPFDVWVSQIGTGRFTNLTRGTEAIHDIPINRSVGFSPDGAEIWLAGNVAGRRLQLRPLLGGLPRVFLQENAINVSWSPDGAFVAYNSVEPGDPISVAERSGANSRQIYVSPMPGGHNHFPLWSPDGRWIYFVSGVSATREMDVWRIRPSGGPPERLTNHNNDVTYPTVIDSRRLMYLSPAEDGSGPWLWVLDTEVQATRRASFGLEKYTSLAATADGRRLVATVSNATVTLWRVPILDRPAEESDATPFPVSTVRALAPRFGVTSLFYLSSLDSGDGLWRYQDNQAVEIWKGTDGVLLEPAGISADGKRVAISLRREGRIRLNVMRDDGTGITPLAESIDVRGSASWSPDGTWIVTGGIDAKGQPGLFKIPVDGGEPVRLTAAAAFDPVWSPDGEMIVYEGAFVSGFQPLLAVRPDGTAVELPDIRLRFVTDGERHRFMPDSKSLVYMDYEIAPASMNFWLLDLVSRQSRRLTRLAYNGSIRTFDITPDGRQIVFDRLRENSDVVLIDLSR